MFAVIKSFYFKCNLCYMLLRCTTYDKCNVIFTEMLDMRVLQRTNVAAYKCCSVQMLQRTNVAAYKCCSVQMLQRTNVIYVDV